MTTDTITLVAKSVWYYSQNDEAAFFEWLDKLKCVSKYEGKEDVLYIYILGHDVNETALRDLLALFRRYSIDLKQFVVFDREEFAPWFRDKKSYWYRRVFGAHPKTAGRREMARRKGD